MTLDALDQAFVDRWRSRPTPPAEAPRPTDFPRESDSAREFSPLVAKLLTSAALQWQALADEVAAARLAGHRVIALTGGERGEGRTTLVTCLAETLRRRGRDVTVCTGVDVVASVDGIPGGGQLHDKRIVLVDAGVWFPPGPIRRERLLVVSMGCDAAILIRRADRAPAPAWPTALAAVGVEPLGEVVTFAAINRSAEGEAA